MKRILILMAVSLSLLSTGNAQGGGGERTKKKKDTKKNSGIKTTIPNLTVAIAQRVLIRHLNDPSADNVLWTCRACYSDDKEENDDFVVVSEYSNLSQYLTARGYIRKTSDGSDVFTAKAKRSGYFDGYAIDGVFGGAGFRFANFRNPKITVNRIIDPKHVPIEYDLVPTEVTMEFFGQIQRVQSFAAFSYEDRKWNICIACAR
jgi:hypothetical protein